MTYLTQQYYPTRDIRTDYPRTDQVSGTGKRFKKGPAITVLLLTLLMISLPWKLGFCLVRATPDNQPPALAATNLPMNGATGIALPVTLNVTVSDPDGGNLTVNFFGRPKMVSTPKFSMAVLPDAQKYTALYDGGAPETFIAQTQWCVDNKVTRNIAYVSQVGDITNGNESRDWRNANAAMSLLETTKPGIPYGIALGNHDFFNPPTLAERFFPVSRFEGRSYYGGHYGSDNENHYNFFSSGGLEFILINLGSGSDIPQPEILAWADGLLKTYSYKRAILVNHSILYPGNPANFTPPGQVIYDALKNNPNLFLMLCGHTQGEGRRTDYYNGNTIYSVLADYTTLDNGGDGWFRIMEFDPSANMIHVSTYTPTLKQENFGADSKFDLFYGMNSNTYRLLGTTTVASGAQASLAWPALVPSGGYEWYATVSDGVNTITGPVSSFTTGSFSIGSATKTDVTCYGSATGTVVAGVVSNPVGSVQYSWKNSSGTVVGTSATVTNLPANTYTLTVSDETTTLSGGSVTIRQPAAPVTLTSNLSATWCSSVAGTYTATSTNGASGYTWKRAVVSGISNPAVTAGSGAIIQETLVNTTTAPVIVHYLITPVTNGCNGTTADVAVTVNPLPSPAGAITGNNSVCAGTSAITYSISPVVNAAGYVWTLPSGATLVSGAGTTSITVNYSVTAVSGNVTVCGTNSCGTGTVSTLPVVVKPLTAAAGPVTGPSAVCQGTGSVTYSVSTIANATGYNWNVPSGVTIVSGANSNTLVVDFGLNAVSGNLTVYGSNSCGNGAASSLALTVKPVVAAAGAISGPVSACQGTTGISFSVSPVANATGYTWSIPAGAVIVSGNNTNSILVDLGLSAVSGNVSVSGTNSCGNGTASVLALTVKPLVGAAGPISGPPTVCQGSTGVTYSVAPIANASGYSWSLPAGATIASGSNTNTITVDLGMGTVSGTISVYGSNSCGNGSTASLAVTVKPLVTAAGPVSGPTSACQGTTGLTFSVLPVANATGYTWSLPPGATLVSGANSNSIVVDLGLSAVSGSVTVSGTNSCGNGTVSTLALTVKPLVGAAGPVSGPSVVCQGSTGVTFSVAPIANATGYVWSVPAGATIVSGSNTNMITLDLSMATVSGTLSVFGTNSCGNGPGSPVFTLTVNQLPAKPVVTAEGTTIKSSASSGNQWFFSSSKDGSGAEISGATGSTLTPAQSGWYWVQVTSNSCKSEVSNRVYRLKPGEENRYNVFPVPNNGEFTISIITAGEEVMSIRIYDSRGQKYYEQTGIEINGEYNKSLNLRNAATGLYTAIILNKSGNAVMKKFNLFR